MISLPAFQDQSNAAEVCWEMFPSALFSETICAELLSFSPVEGTARVFKCEGGWSSQCCLLCP